MDFPKEAFDNFGRVKTSEPKTQFEIDHTLDSRDLFTWTELTGGATAIHNPLTATLDLSTSGVAGDRAVHQSKRYIQYQKGKSFFIFITGTHSVNLSETCRMRMGLFDDDRDKTVDNYGDGVFAEWNGGEFGIGHKSSTINDTNTETVVSITDFEALNKFSSSLAKKVRLAGLDKNSANMNIYFFDVEWLGAGNIRFGAGQLIDGSLNYAHTIENIGKYDRPYMRRAYLPIRWEIEQMQNGDPDTMRVNCATVISEGGYSPLGTIFSSEMLPIDKVQVNSNLTPVLALRTKGNYNRITFNPLSLKCLVDTGGDMIIRPFIAIPSKITVQDPTVMRTPHRQSAVEYFTGSPVGVTIDTTTLDNVDSPTEVIRMNARDEFIPLPWQVISGDINQLITSFLNTLLPASNIAGEGSWLFFCGCKVNQNEQIILISEWQEWY
jgi:hypothetical protein